MNLKINKIIDILNNIDKIKTLKLKARLWLSIIRLKEQLEKALEQYEKARIALCEQYAKKDENGKPVIRLENNQNVYDIEEMPEFSRQLFELQNTTFEINIDQVDEFPQDLELTGEQAEILMLLCKGN